MKIATRTGLLVLVGLLSVLGTARADHAVDEIEGGNDSIDTPQLLEISDNSITVNGAVGNVSGTAIDDVDFYKFYAMEGDNLKLQVTSAIATSMAVYSTDSGYPMVPNGWDQGSGPNGSSLIDPLLIPATGYYIVGVTYEKAGFQEEASAGERKVSFAPVNGAYTLAISGFPVNEPEPEPVPEPEPSVQTINIVIWPDRHHSDRFRHVARGKIRVALLSSSEFSPLLVDRDSLTFGLTGNEQSLVHCRESRDVNRDGRVDLVCWFDLRKTNFGPYDVRGILRGTTEDGQLFEGQDLVRLAKHRHKHEKHNHKHDKHNHNKHSHNKYKHDKKHGWYR